MLRVESTGFSHYSHRKPELHPLFCHARPVFQHNASGKTVAGHHLKRSLSKWRRIELPDSKVLVLYVVDAEYIGLQPNYKQFTA